MLESVCMSDQQFSNFEDDPYFSQLILDLSPNILFVKDRQGRFVFANRAYTEVYNTKLEDLLGKSDSDFNPNSDEVEQHSQLEQRIMDLQEELFVAQERVSNAEGDILWLQTIKRPLVRADGSCNHVLGVCVDISERIRAEERERELNERLARINRMESLGVMAGGIAHDLNNILGPLVGYPEMIKERVDADDETVHAMIDDMASSAEYARAVIQDLLLTAHKGICRYTPVSINNCLEMYLESPSYRTASQLSNAVEVNIEMGDGIPAIEGNGAQIIQIIMNLVNNAFHAIGHDGKLSIRTGVETLKPCVIGLNELDAGSYVYLEVKDDGVGISKADQENIYEPFFSSKHEKGIGTGLGLSVVYGIVHQMAGSVELESEAGEGARFRLRFPALGYEALEPTETIALEEQGEGRVLVIDDNEFQRELGRRSLQRYGYEVDAASSGEQGLAMLEKDQNYDMVLIDMLMPKGWDGLETFNAVQKFRAGLPCIIVSGFSSNMQIELALDQGAVAFVQKPYSPKALAQEVKKALARTSTS